MINPLLSENEKEKKNRAGEKERERKEGDCISENIPLNFQSSYTVHCVVLGE